MKQGSSGFTGLTYMDQVAGPRIDVLGGLLHE
jgi:hypothetical protein